MTTLGARVGAAMMARMQSASFTVRSCGAIADVPAAAWDACANPPGATTEENGGDRHNPFVSHAFLAALERSGSVGGRSGWTPAHLLIEDSAGKLVACAPAYLKSHSQGEYVFDHGWAEAYSRVGGRYYPKLQVAVPFTPVPGRRLLVAADAPPGAFDALVKGLRALRAATKTSSIHVTFASAEESRRLSEEGFLARTGEQFHFVNEGYSDFDAFLNALSSRKRKAIRRERRDALGDDLRIEHITGAALEKRHWDAFFSFYMDTGSRKWGRPYLNRAFFDLVGQSMPDRIVLMLAMRGDKPIAGALNFLGDDALYGRYWGENEHRPFLHFELCYYQAMDFALARGLKRVEAGAQGEHKLLRGYRAVATHSLHELNDARLSAAVEEYLERERAAVEHAIEESEAALPFRHED
jgi:uncharacterized protein